MAVLGRVPGTEHYRNVLRHRVLTQPAVLALRVDESLSSLNIGFLRDRVQREVAARPEARHLLLVCSAVNGIEGGALVELEALVADLRAAGMTTHLADQGLSIVADPYGRTLAAMDHFRATERVMVAQVPLRGVATVYARIGDLCGWLSVLGLALLAILGWRRGRGEPDGGR